MRTPQLFPDVGLRRTMCILSHFRTCDVRAEVRAERVCNCACVVGRAQPDITSGPEVRQILKCPDSGLPVFFLPGLRTL